MNKNLSRQSGITLLELIIATAIIGVISMISTSAYTGYVEATKISQAVSQIKALSFIIDDYADENGQYPQSLADIGNQNLKDPWGNSYIYMNLARDNGNDDDHGNGNNDDDHGNSHDDDGHGNSHDDDGHGNSHDDDGHGNNDNNDHSSGNDINIGAARKDGNLTPINTKYDLCSSGKDGKSKAPLRAKESHDDIIYANDGGYIGIASDF